MRPLLLVLLVPLLLGSESKPRPPKQEAKRFRLELHAPQQGGIYFSAWGDGNAITDKDASDGKPVTYRRRYIWSDRCTWEATELLTPIEVNQYKYEYRETPLSCPSGAAADTGSTTPRDGKVSVHPADDGRPLTPLTAWAKGWNKPRN